VFVNTTEPTSGAGGDDGSVKYYILYDPRKSPCERERERESERDHGVVNRGSQEVLYTFYYFGSFLAYSYLLLLSLSADH